MNNEQFVKIVLIIVLALISILLVCIEYCALKFYKKHQNNSHKGVNWNRNYNSKNKSKEQFSKKVFKALITLIINVFIFGVVPFTSEAINSTLSSAIYSLCESLNILPQAQPIVSEAEYIYSFQDYTYYKNVVENSIDLNSKESENSIPVGINSIVDRITNTIVKPPISTSDYEKNIAAYEKLVAKAPDYPMFQQQLASQSLDYAKIIKKSDHPKSYKKAESSVNCYKNLLMYNNKSIKNADIYYRIGQGYQVMGEINNILNQPEKAYSNELYALIYFTLSFQDTEYKESKYYGFSYYMAAIVAHQIGNRQIVKDNINWYTIAKENYETALNTDAISYKHSEIEKGLNAVKNLIETYYEVDSSNEALSKYNS